MGKQSETETTTKTDRPTEKEKEKKTEPAIKTKAKATREADLRRKALRRDLRGRRAEHAEQGRVIHPAFDLFDQTVQKQFFL